MNPATPGTILILVAAVLLAVCTASVPVNKSIYFLSITAARRTVTFGCLGFCVGDQCSGTTVGYKLSDAGSLFGINGNIPYANQLSSSVLHGLSYTLVLHPVACGLSAVAFLLGILQHCTGFATAFLTSMVAGFATTVTLIALALDFALFTIAKKRVESDGGTASYGTAIWLTLAAFIVLVVAQCAVCCSCCAGRGGGGSRKRNKKDKDDYSTPHPDASYGERMRMDALQAENDRLRRQKNGGEGQLPRFAEYVTEHEVPLKHDYDDGGNGQVHHAVGQAYGGGNDGAYHNGYARQGGAGRSTVAAGAGAAAGAAAASHYVPGVGPVYGQGNGNNRESVAYNEVGGFGAHGAGLDQEQQPQHDYYDPHSQQQGYGAHDAQQQDYYDQSQGQYEDYYAPQHQQQPHHEQGVALGPSGSYYDDSGVGSSSAAPAVGALAMPTPQRAAGSAAASGGILARSASAAPTDASAVQQEQRDRDERRRPTQDDGFGLSALAASATSPPRDEKAQLRAAEAERERQATQGGAGTSEGHWQEPSGMYFDAEEDNGAASSSHYYGGGGGAGGSQNHHDVPSYEHAIGAITAEQEAARRAGGGSRSASAAGTSRSRGPLPAVPPSSSSHHQQQSYYPREKY